MTSKQPMANFNGLFEKNRLAFSLKWMQNIAQGLIVDKVQLKERNRQLENEDDDEMGTGRTKKIKCMDRYHVPQPPNNQGKLPNPFQEQQSSQYQNGNYRNQ